MTTQEIQQGAMYNVADLSLYVVLYKNGPDIMCLYINTDVNSVQIINISQYRFSVMLSLSPKNLQTIYVHV